ncbi:MAG: hypothetical protein AAFW00_25860 [Bacteroidota bacterium]
MLLSIFQEVADWIKDIKDWEKVSVILLLTLSTLGWLSRMYMRFRQRQRAHNVAKDLHPFYNSGDIRKATQYYVTTHFQSSPPSQYSELIHSHKVTAREPLIPFFLQSAFSTDATTDQGDPYLSRFYMILAGSGMGKTTFMINLYLAYLKQKRLGKAKYQIKLLPLGHPDVLKYIDKIDNQEQTILLLDGLDEDPQAARRFQRRMDRVLNRVQHFRVVVFTCRTQFFASEKEEPFETKVRKFGGRHGFHTFVKLYLSPFNQGDIKQYLTKRYGVLESKKKEKALQIISQSPSLMVRPMILSYIDDLLEESADYAEVTTLYQVLIQKWIEREANRVEADRRTNFSKELYRFSQEVALNIYQNRRHRNGLYIGEKEIANLAQQHDIKLEEIEMRSRSLLNRNMLGHYKFAHKSILEYFLALESMDNTRFAQKFSFEGMDQTRVFMQEFILFEKTLPFFKDEVNKLEFEVLGKKGKKRSELTTKDILNITLLEVQDLKDVQILYPLKNLQVLKLHGGTIDKLSVLSFFPTLISLTLDSLPVQHISEIQHLSQLQKLHIISCPIRHIDPLRDFTDLRELAIVDTEVSKIDTLRNLSQLWHLELVDNQIPPIVGFDKFKELKYLRLNKTLLSERIVKKLKRNFPKLKIDWV